MKVKIIYYNLLFLLYLLPHILDAQEPVTIPIYGCNEHNNLASIELSSDGKYAVSGCLWDYTLKLWDVQSGANFRTFTGHTDRIYSIAISPDGESALSGSSDKTMKLWDVQSGANIRTFTGHTDWISSVAFSPDGKYALSGSGDKSLKLWDVQSGVNIRTYTGHNDYICMVAFSPDGKYALSGSSDKTIKLWDVQSGINIRTFTGHTDRIYSVVFSPDGKYALSGSQDKTLKLWDVQSGINIRTFTGHTDWISSVAFSSDGKYALSGSSDKTLKLWDVQSGRIIRTYTGHTSFIVSVAFSPDGKYALSGSYDNTVKIWETGVGISTFDAGKPPIIAVAGNKLNFIDENNNNAIDAYEHIKIRLEVKNTGKGTGRGLTVKVNARGAKVGLEFDASTAIPDIPAGQSYTAEIPIIANGSTENGTVNFCVKIDEPHGFGSDTIEIEIPTKSFTSPLVKVVDYTITGSSGNNLNRKQPFDLQLLIQNVKPGIAENVSIEMRAPANVLCFSQNENQILGQMKAGDKKEVVYSLIVSENYTQSSIPINIQLSEKMGKYAENKAITLNLNQALSSNKITIKANPDQTQLTEITEASLSSDVDKNIPRTAVKNENTYALIIGNENYADYQSGINTESNVDFARNDARVFKEYCENILGIPSENITFMTDATAGKMMQSIDKMRNLIKTSEGRLHVVVYYAGHGLPDQVTHEAYLIPVDVNGNNLSTAIKTTDLYNKLTEYPSRGVTVFLDACFSGGARNQPLSAARGIRIEPKQFQPHGKLTIFSASSGEQTSLPFRDKNHGIFTYFLLKKLQETKGDISYQALADYLNHEVKFQSVKINSKEQEPQMINGSEINTDLLVITKLKDGF